jgi:hypothetical protein
LWHRDESNKLQPRIANVAEIANAIIFLTSEQSLKITGHIMKVDGGKSLTTSDFEPKRDLNGGLFPKLLQKTTGTASGPQVPAPRTAAFDDWINKTVQESNWSTHHEDAHFKVLQDYKTEELDQAKLEHEIMMQQEGGAANPKRAAKITK